jgi:glycosidase
MNRSPFVLKSLVLALLSITTIVNAETPDALHVRSPEWREQIIYFVMIDRFNDGNSQNNDQGTGEFDPAKSSHYSGGDLPGITDKINYIKALGATSVWITPPVAHQWWSTPANYGGYHGYWGENLMQVDAHFGTLADMKNLSRALHGQGMYLIQDVVVNHMGNYFAYDSKQWDPARPESGFRLEAGSTQARAPSQEPFRFNNAADPQQAARGIYHWTPDIVDYTNPEQEHNWQMAGLDDINTENPEARKALRQSYGYWIAQTGVDAFRVDTAFYVPPNYFRDFLYADQAEAPGMLAVAKATGRDDFLVFGEGFAIDKAFEKQQSEKIEGYVRNPEGQPLMPGMINFPLYGTGLDVFAKGQPTSQMRYRIDTMMAVHENPHLMPSFVDNHDVDRFLAGGSQAALKQNLLLIMTLPGIPVIYYGTEQGFTKQRAAMFKTGWGSGGKDHFNTGSDLFKSIQAMTALRRGNKLFSHGRPTVLKDNEAGPGVLAYRMQYGEEQAFVIFNTADTEVLLDNLDTGLAQGSRLKVLYSQLPFAADIPVGRQGALSLTLPGRSALVLKPDGTVLATPVPDSHLQISALPERVLSETMSISGTADRNAALQLVLDGDLSQAIAVRADSKGHWQATLATDTMMDPAILHRLVLWDPLNKHASKAQTFRAEKSWREILRVDDPSGDDKGRTGLIRYPTDPGWGENRQGDIERITVYQAGSALKLDITLHSLTAFWNPPNGFDHVAVTAFFELPGKAAGSRVMPLQNAELPEGMRWHYRLRSHGWTNAWFNNQNADAQHEGQTLSPGAGLKADMAKRTISFILPAKVLGNPESLKGAKVYVNTWDYDAGYRKLSPEGGNMLFGGGQPDDAKVLDESPVLVIP